MAFQNSNKTSEQFLNGLFWNLSQFPIWQPMAEIGWTAECGKKLPDKKCRKKLYFPSSIILEKTGLDSENHVRSSSCWRPSFIMQLKLLATICMIKTRKTYRTTLKILPRSACKKWKDMWVSIEVSCKFVGILSVLMNSGNFLKVLKSSTWILFLCNHSANHNADLQSQPTQ